MNIRNYNIYFSTHTVSGIVISALLYIIFFAGSFSFFKKEISAWQKNESFSQQTLDPTVYAHFLDSLAVGYNLQGRDLSFYLQQQGLRGYVMISDSQDSMVNKQRGGVGASDSKYLVIDFLRNKTSDYATAYDLGEFLYRLHFLAPLNEIPIYIGIAPFGYFIAGLTAFLFLFALLTGLLLHWDKVKANFFVFRPFSKWKTVWTDMHTALGVIGFPYQFIFAVTGIILIINTVLLNPFAKVFYQGDMSKVQEAIENVHTYPLTYSYTKLEKTFDITSYIQLAQKKFPNSDLKKITIKNYGDQQMHIIMETEAPSKHRFSGAGILAIKIADGGILEEKSLAESSYIDAVKSIIYRLHFGDFGGYPIKVIYFILGVMGCFVILSGILIWLVARDKNNVIPRKRKFNFWVANVFMATCLSLLPVTALTFCLVKLAPEVNQQFIYRVYFNLWWVLALYYCIRRNINRTNRETLLLGAMASLAIPIVNGIKTGDWLISNFIKGRMDIFIVDFLWVVIGIVSFTVLYKLKEYKLSQP